LRLFELRQSINLVGRAQNFRVKTEGFYYWRLTENEKNLLFLINSFGAWAKNPTG